MPVQHPNEAPAGAPRKYERDAHPERDPRQTPMTLAQASYLMTLCEEAGEALDDSLTGAEAARRIEELEDATGRGRGHGPTNIAAPISEHPSR